jgi:putative transcriptional regulator
MTQVDLARRTGIRPSTINAYFHEYVERMNKSDIDKMCKVLGCRIDDLLEYRKKPD